MSKSTALPGRGTSVTLYLPRSQAVVAERDAGKTKIARAIGRGERVLVVEDDVEVRAAAISALTDLGYEVREAGDGPSALALLRGGAAVDLLFTDVVLPNGMSGFELYREALRERPALKILFASGYSEDFVKQRDDLPIDLPLVTKPYRRTALAEALAKALS